MKKILSFSLWGSNPKYTEGAIKNVKLARQYFAGFTCRFYIDATVPRHILDELEKNNCELIAMDEVVNIPRMFWRFLPADDESVGLFLSRDTDSRLSLREWHIVEAWEKSSSNFLIIKDNPYYHAEFSIMGGLWGMKRIPNFSMVRKIESWLAKSGIDNPENYNVDQRFLVEVIFPEARSSMDYYDDFNLNKLSFCKKIPVKRESYRFIGESFNEYDKPDIHWKAIRGHNLKRYGFIGRKINTLLLKLQW